MTNKKKSVEANVPEQTSPVAAQPPSTLPISSNPVTPVLENLEQIALETSVDSFDSTSPLPLTPPPAKPPRNGDESASSSSAEIHSPPVKPPRHFSLYANQDDEGLIQQTDTAVKKVLSLVDTFGIVSNDDADMNILRETTPNIYIQQASNSTDETTLSTLSPSDLDRRPDFKEPDNQRVCDDSSSNLEEIVQEIRSRSPPPEDTSSVDVNLTQDNELFIEEPLPPLEITTLATNLTTRLLENVEDELRTQNRQITEHRTETIENVSISLPPQEAQSQANSTQSTSRPLVFVALDSNTNVMKPTTAIVEIASSKPTPKVTTSVTIISPPQPEISSLNAATTISSEIVSDDDEALNSSSTLMPNSSVASDRLKFLQSSSKESSIDSNDTNPYDAVNSQQFNAGSATPARSLISDYDNLHGSYNSLNDDSQVSTGFVPNQLPSSVSTETASSMPTTTSSSMSTIYETADNMSTSSTNTATSHTYASARSTLHSEHTSGSVTPAYRINSDISDEDLVESFEIESPILPSNNQFRSPKGRIASSRSKDKHDLICFYAFTVA